MPSDISERFSCVLLAAGASRRLGEPKQLVRLDGETLIRHSAQKLIEIGAVEIVVVTGYESDNCLKELSDMPVRVVFNADWKDGMGSSLAAGVNHLSVPAAGVLVLLCDQWKVSRSDLRSLVDHWLTDISQVICAQWGSQRGIEFGPPVIFPKSLFSELQKLNGDRGARPIIEKNRSGVTFVTTENAAFDLDKPADLVPMRSGSSSSD